MNMRDPRWVPTSQLFLVFLAGMGIGGFTAQDGPTSPRGWVALFLNFLMLILASSMILRGIWKAKGPNGT